METVLKYEKVAKRENRKVMLDCEEIATGEDFKVYQSANKNVITIAKSEFYYHIILEQIVDSVLCADSAHPKDTEVGKLKQRNGELEKAVKNILHWKKVAENTPEMLMSQQTTPAKANECAEIMQKYEESFKIAEQSLAN